MKRYTPTLEAVTAIMSFKTDYIFENEDLMNVCPEIHLMFFNQLGPDGKDLIGCACLELAVFSLGEYRDKSYNLMLELIPFCSTDVKDIKENSEFMNPYYELYRLFKIENRNHVND